MRTASKTKQSEDLVGLFVLVHSFLQNPHENWRYKKWPLALLGRCWAASPGYASTASPHHMSWLIARISRLAEKRQLNHEL